MNQIKLSNIIIRYESIDQFSFYMFAFASAFASSASTIVLHPSLTFTQ